MCKDSGEPSPCCPLGGTWHTQGQRVPQAPTHLFCLLCFIHLRIFFEFLFSIEHYFMYKMNPIKICFF